MDARLPPAPEDWQRALAIVAHPDDLEYGASGAIAMWTAAGKRVGYLMVSSGERGIDALAPDRAGPLRADEERESARLVGVGEVEFLGYPDGLIEYGLPLRRDLSRAIRRARPEVLITLGFDLAWPGGQLNQADHRAVGLAVCDAARDAANRWIFPELLEEGLAPWSARWVFVAAAARPTHAVEIGPALEAGIASLRAQRTYFEHLSGDFDVDAFLRGQAAAAGARFGVQYAVELAVYGV